MARECYVTGKKGMIMRQCTNDYKIQPIKKKIRELCDVGYKKHFPKDNHQHKFPLITNDIKFFRNTYHIKFIW